DRPIAKEGHGDAIAFEKLEGIAGAGGLQNVRPDDAARAHEADFGREEVHAAAAAPRAPRFAAVQFGDELQRRDALGEGVAVAAVGAEDHVAGPQRRAHAHGHGFLTHVSMASPVDQPALVRLRQLLFAAANQHHLPVQPEQFLGLRKLDGVRHGVAFLRMGTRLTSTPPRMNPPARKSMQALSVMSRCFIWPTTSLLTNPEKLAAMLIVPMATAAADDVATRVGSVQNGVNQEFEKNPARQRKT